MSNTTVRVNRTRLRDGMPCISVLEAGGRAKYTRRVDFLHDGVVIASVVQGADSATVWMEPTDEAEVRISEEA